MEAQEGGGDPGPHRDPPLYTLVSVLCLVLGLALALGGAFICVGLLDWNDPDRAVLLATLGLVMIPVGCLLLRCWRRR